MTDQPLAIRILEVTRYPAGGQGYTTRSTPNPTWNQVETAIRALDHHSLPFIFIGLRDACRGEDCLSVLGGPRGYAISAADSDGGWMQYCDPSHSGGEVPVWTSDQGYYPPARFVTYDLELVLRVARHYAESGELDPSVKWEE
jgi:immunity protein Imm1 of predicted polymorphic toxin system